MNLRIANVIEEGKLGGPQVRICVVAAALKGQAETTVIIPKENSKAFQQRCDACEVSYIGLPITRITKEWQVAVRYVLFSWFEVLWLAWILKRDNYDLIHASGGSWQFKGVLAAKLAGKKVLWHLNDTSMPGFIRRLFAVISRFADGFIFASERSKEYYRPLMRSNKPEFVVPAPVDTQQCDPRGYYPGDEELIEKWDGDFVVGMVANINPVKGIETFVRTVAALNNREFKARFVVIGAIYRNQQRYLERLQRLCAELVVTNIEFVGGRSDVRPLLKRFDVYLCSSCAESSPLSVWEAMAMGKPVVSTDVGDVPLYVRDGYNGFIVDVGDATGLADRLARLVDDSELRHTFGVRCREIAIQQLGIEQCAKRHLAAYSNILGLK